VEKLKAVGVHEGRLEILRRTCQGLSFWPRPVWPLERYRGKESYATLYVASPAPPTRRTPFVTLSTGKSLAGTSVR
jgi:hypothetical protein